MTLNNEKMDNVVNNFTDMSNYARTMIDDVVNKITSNLDTIIEKINSDIIVVEAPVNVVENYYLELVHELYFVAQATENLGLNDSLSKIYYKNTYNNCYLEPSIDKAKPTVAELTASAENDSLYEMTLNDIYNKAYKICKAKVDCAQTMVSSLSKVISRRIAESQLGVTSSSRNYLAE